MRNAVTETIIYFVDPSKRGTVNKLSRELP
jgi:hypothetical protein